MLSLFIGMVLRVGSIIHWGDIIHVTMSGIAGIYMLQQIDSKINRSNERIDQIDVVLADKQDVIIATKAFDKATDAMEIAVKKHAVIQGEIDIVTSKYEHGEKRLYSGVVTNPKELKDLQNQGDALTRRIVELEDKKLEAMIAEEDCNEMLHEATIHRDITIDKRAVVENELTLERDDLLSRIGGAKAEREVSLNTIGEDLLRKYDSARAKYRGIAVVLVKDGICSGCGLRVSTARAQAARGGDTIVNCDNCNRFLYGK